MNTHRVNISRRRFLIGSAAAGAGFSLGLYLPLARSEAQAEAATPEVNAWVVIEPDETVLLTVDEYMAGLDPVLARVLEK